MSIQIVEITESVAVDYDAMSEMADVVLMVSLLNPEKIATATIQVDADSDMDTGEDAFFVAAGTLEEMNSKTRIDDFEKIIQLVYPKGKIVDIGLGISSM